MFDDLIGNEIAKNYLVKTLEKGTMGNSLLFAGPDGIGKSLFAQAFAKQLFCHNNPNSSHKRKLEAGTHPDLRVYRPEGKIGVHTIASMREFSGDVYLAPFEAKYKVFIIDNADRMLPYSANALLKTFEEPAEDTIIILVSSSPTSLLPTVLSRCRIIHFQPISEELIANFLIEKKGVSPEEACTFAAMAQGSLGGALKLVEKGGDPQRKIMLEALSCGQSANYTELSKLCALLAQEVEAGKKTHEEEIRTKLTQGAGTHLSAVQKQGLEKEIEGVIAMQMKQEVNALFDVVFSWYRDMELLHVRGNRSYLRNKDYAFQCEQALQRGFSRSLDIVEKAIIEARTSLERSTTVSICFENLFLKLGFL